MQKTDYINVSGIALLFISCSINSYAASDCQLSDINYMEQAGMTRTERLEAMNQAFFESVNRFDECMLSTTSNSSSSSSAEKNASQQAADSVSGSEGQENEFDNADTSNAAASSELSGTESEPVDAAEVAESLRDLADAEAETKTTVSRGSPGSGKAPEDIPDANNDDVVAAQIRLAAEIETDPEKKAKLWNEYRKYKGLPQKP